jgi:hypothetical protein
LSSLVMFVGGGGAGDGVEKSTKPEKLEKIVDFLTPSPTTVQQAGLLNREEREKYWIWGQALRPPFFI